MSDFKLNQIDTATMTDTALSLTECLLSKHKECRAVRVLGGLIERNPSLRLMSLAALVQGITSVACRSGVEEPFEHVFQRTLRRLAAHIRAIYLLPDNSADEGVPDLELTPQENLRSRYDSAR
jgi:hypothetical protein